MEIRLSGDPQKMADDDAREIARRILRLHYELEEWLDAFRGS
jgi:hypothetical protein